MATSAQGTTLKFTPANGAQVTVGRLTSIGEIAPEAGELDVTTLVQRMAQTFQGSATMLYAPMYINSDIVRRELMKEQLIQKALEKINGVDYVLTGIADVALDRPLSTWAGYLTEQKKRELMKKGAVGYICGYFFDRDGNKLLDSINDKIIGISFEKLKKGPRVIAAAGGVDKTHAICGALRGRLIDCLITDSRIAEKLMGMQGGLG